MLVSLNRESNSDRGIRSRCLSEWGWSRARVSTNGDNLFGCCRSTNHHLWLTRIRPCSALLRHPSSKRAKSSNVATTSGATILLAISTTNIQSTRNNGHLTGPRISNLFLPIFVVVRPMKMRLAWYAGVSLPSGSCSILQQKPPRDIL